MAKRGAARSFFFFLLTVNQIAVVVLVIPPAPSHSSAWIPAARRRPTASSLRSPLARARTHTNKFSSLHLSNDGNDEDPLEKSEGTDEITQEEEIIIRKEFNLDEFLDTPFFQPDKVLEDETSNPLLKRLASFVVADYAKAEAVLSGIFFVVLIVVAQEILRMQLYGDNYEPFSRGVLPGNLF